MSPTLLPELDIGPSRDFRLPVVDGVLQPRTWRAAWDTKWKSSARQGRVAGGRRATGRRPQLLQLRDILRIGAARRAARSA